MSQRRKESSGITWPRVHRYKTETYINKGTMVGRGLNRCLSESGCLCSVEILRDTESSGSLCINNIFTSSPLKHAEPVVAFNPAGYF